MTTEVGDYTIYYTDVLGEGSFGRVFRGRHKDTGDIVAAKNIILKWHNVEWVNQELEIINSISDHDNILKGLYNKKDDGQVWIILEYCDLGNLSTYAARGPLDLFSKLDIVHQSTIALVHLLGLRPTGVVHRDIKPENILLKSTATGFQVKVCDFGIARQIDATAMETKCGTHHFKAPELFEEEPSYTKAVDVFALGILILHLLRAGPGQNLECEEVRGDPVGELLKRILKLTVTKGNGRKRMQQEKWNPVVFYMDDCEDVILLKRLVVTMLSADQSHRPTMEQVHEEVGRIKSRVKSTASRYDAASGPVRGGNLVTDRSNASEVEGSIVQPKSSVEIMQEDIYCLRMQLLDVEQAYRQSQQENNHLKSRQEQEKQNLTKELENARKAHRDTLKENSNLKEQIQKAADIHERTLKENKKQILQKEEVEQNYEDSKQAIHKLTMDLEGTLKENSNLKEQIHKATNIHERTLKENKMQILQEEVEQNYEDSKQAIHKLTMDLEDLKIQLSETKTLHNVTLQENKNLENKLQESLKNHCETLHNLHKENSTTRSQLEEVIKGRKDALQENEQLNNKIQEDKQFHKQEVEKMANKLHEALEEKAYLTSQLDEIKTKSALLVESTLQRHLEKAQRKHENISQNINTQLQEAKEEYHKVVQENENLTRRQQEMHEEDQQKINEMSRQLKEAEENYKNITEENIILTRQLEQQNQKMHEEYQQKMNEMTRQLKDAEERCENIIQENKDLTRQLEQDQKMHEEQTKSRREQKAEESPGSILQYNECLHSSTVIHRIHSIQLDYSGHRIAAFSPQLIVMGIVDSSELVCYKVSDTINFAWRKRLSSSFSSDCRKHVMSSLFLYQSDRNLPTEILSLGALQNQTSHPAGRGYLCAALPGERLLYASGGRSYIDLEMRDLRSGRIITTLTPPRGTYKKDNIAASSHPSSGELVVVNTDEQSFDIYSNQYVFKRRCELAFRPESITSVVALEEFVIILNSGRDKVHIHNWLGEEVDVVNGFQLGLPEDGRKIHGIGQGPPGTIIVAAGKDNIVQTLNLFKV